VLGGGIPRLCAASNAGEEGQRRGIYIQFNWRKLDRDLLRCQETCPVDQRVRQSGSWGKERRVGHCDRGIGHRDNKG
jgi:hypothetical protein